MVLSQSKLAKAASNSWANRNPRLMFLWSPKVSSPNKTSIRSAVSVHPSRVTDRRPRYGNIDRYGPHFIYWMRPKTGGRRPL